MNSRNQPSDLQKAIKLIRNYSKSIDDKEKAVLIERDLNSLPLKSRQMNELQAAIVTIRKAGYTFQYTNNLFQ